MSAYLAQLETDIRTVVAATWTDTKAGGIFEGQNLEMIPWDTVGVPFAFFTLDVQPCEDMNAQGVNYYVGVTCGYIGATAGNSSLQIAKGEALRDALLTAGSLTNGCVMDVPTINWGHTIQPNMDFVKKDYTHRAVLVNASVFIGETWP